MVSRPFLADFSGINSIVTKVDAVDAIQGTRGSILTRFWQ